MTETVFVEDRDVGSCYDVIARFVTATFITAVMRPNPGA
jgi:hypothetical protein